MPSTFFNYTTGVSLCIVNSSTPSSSTLVEFSPPLLPVSLEEAQTCFLFVVMASLSMDLSDYKRKRAISACHSYCSRWPYKWVTALRLERMLRVKIIHGQWQRSRLPWKQNKWTFGSHHLLVQFDTELGSVIPDVCHTDINIILSSDECTRSSGSFAYRERHRAQLNSIMTSNRVDFTGEGIGFNQKPDIKTYMLVLLIWAWKKKNIGKLFGNTENSTYMLR